MDDVVAATEPAAAPVPPQPSTPARPRWRLGAGPVIGAVFVLALLLHVLFDRFTPYTSEASLQAPIIPLAPNVSGTLIEALVDDNQPVSSGQLLARIDPQRYQAAVSQARANLEAVSQGVGADTTALVAARARVTEAEAQLAKERLQAGRVLELVRRGVYSEAQGDDARASLATAEASLSSARAGLEAERERLGPTGADNPEVRAAMAALERAEIDLIDTELRAPVDGMLTNTVLAPGQYAAAGQRVGTIVDTHSAWIMANLPENALTRVRPGDPVEITFNAAPGRVVRGRVTSIAAGVRWSVVGAEGDLPFVPERRRWLRETQRIPVRIELERQADMPAVRVGSRVAVLVLPPESGFLAPLARVWLRVVAYANFAF